MGKVLTNKVMQKTSSNKAPKRTSKDHLNVKCVVGEIDLVGGAVQGRICPVSDEDLSKHSTFPSWSSLQQIEPCQTSPGIFPLPMGRLSQALLHGA